ncbi:6-phosphogluconolactonase [Longibacter salinarum]|uniref:6-phosphogluconolactonase n=1 Tax=Longibacter salinarum TaxID=1850348 RepID=A0A2A8CYB6_9BACT|nr:6-phosphogluconolactonase [Longibacter salinarum]PEN13712.1 6-phosphogluconolactonase [Longibacter salinarum]
MSDVHVFPTLDALSRAAAQHIAAHVQTVLLDQDVYALALAGGSTPERTYELLASGFPRIPWERVHLFWGDERFVPSSSPQSNERMARRRLLSSIDVPSSNVHPIPTDAGSPAAAARRYEQEINSVLSGRDHTFDLAVLGIGSDGHTASLFPDDPMAVTDHPDDRLVRAVQAPDTYDVRDRITCTLKAFNSSSEAVFLASGEGKQSAVQRAQAGDPALPASHISPRGRLTWFLDPDAAAKPPTTRSETYNSS